MSAFLTGSAAQWGLLGAFITAFFTALGIWFKYGPDRRRAENEAKSLEVTTEAKLRDEMTALNKQARKDIHDMREQLATMQAKQHFSDRRLLEAATVQRQDRADMDTMMFLIRLLISEVKRLDKSDNNAIIEQAESVLAHLTTIRGAAIPKSDAMASAEHAHHATQETVDAMLAAEGNGI